MERPWDFVRIQRKNSIKINEKKCLLVIDSGASVNIIPPWANDKLK